MKLLSVVLVAGLFATAFSATAGVVVGGTRLVYDGAKKEAALNVSNPDEAPYLIQSWVDTQEGARLKPPLLSPPPYFAWMVSRITYYVSFAQEETCQKIKSPCFG